MLACIPASDDDVACCQISNNGTYPLIAVPNPATWSIMGAITGPDRIPEWFRYVITTEDIKVSPPHVTEPDGMWANREHMEVLP